MATLIIWRGDMRCVLSFRVVCVTAIMAMSAMRRVEPTTPRDLAATGVSADEGKREYS